MPKVGRKPLCIVNVKVILRKLNNYVQMIGVFNVNHPSRYRPTRSMVHSLRIRNPRNYIKACNSGRPGLVLNMFRRKIIEKKKAKYCGTRLDHIITTPSLATPHPSSFSLVSVFRGLFNVLTACTCGGE